MTEQEKLSPLGIVNGPSQAQIDEWKNKYGDIYVATFGENEKYIYRPIRRMEYKQVLELNVSPDNKTFAEEKVAQMCVVWPILDPIKVPTSKAGVISTLVDLIMAASNFGITEEPIKL